MTFEAILTECREQTIGPILWDLLVEVCARVARRYAPDPYNHGAALSGGVQRDVALEVCLERRLE